MRKQAEEASELGVLDAATRGRVLLEIARDSLESEVLGRAERPVATEAWLAEPGATFVTLTQRGALRGCLGSLEARRPLVEDLRANARAAASRDPRFAPVRADELDTVRVEVSLLGALEPVEIASEAEALVALGAGRDGWLLRLGGASATFLPQVWEALPQPREFLRRLQQKAGLAPGQWRSGTELLRYRVEKWRQ